MINSLLLSLRNDVQVQVGERYVLLFDTTGVVLKMSNSGADWPDIIEKLQNTRICRDELLNISGINRLSSKNLRSALLLRKLQDHGLITYTLKQKGRYVVTAEPFSGRLRLRNIQHDKTYRLSRFALFRRENNCMTLESSLGHGRLILHDEGTAAMLCRAGQIVGDGNNSHILNLALSAGVICACDEKGDIFEDTSIPLRLWQHYDLLFHARSRKGRKGPLSGQHNEYMREIPPLPAFKACSDTHVIPLTVPEKSDIEDTDFFEILENRRSIRTAAVEPLTLKQLGLFLYYTGRVQTRLPPDPANNHPYEASLRPCASGGAIHEIEFYLTISRCKDLDSGFYHYDPLNHNLRKKGDLCQLQLGLLQDASAALGNEKCDVLITLAARFQRISWKYSSIAYSLILKNTGSVFQQMGLVATALGLAGCAIGTGNSDAFAEASGLSYLEEGAVGEFALSGGESHQASERGSRRIGKN